ncbi:MAG: hypothetical protein IJM51_01615 [Clostridia bacterium]|nr:hypothetical protein [Clostridia bacterium]
MNYPDIVNRLLDAGIDVAMPGTKQGICTSPYAVVQNAGTFRYAQSDRLGYTLITVHCYVPLYNYEQLDTLLQSVRSSLDALYPDLRFAGNEGAHIINDHFKANEGSLQYIIQRKTSLQ